PVNYGPIECVENAEVSEAEYESAAGDHRPKLHRHGRLDHALAAEHNGLPKEQAGSVELGRFGSALLKLEVLYRASQAADVGEPPFGDDFGDDIGFAPGPKLQAAEKGERPGEASLAVRHQRANAAVRIRVAR